MIIVCTILAVLAFALDGDCEAARRLSKTAFGTALALIAVELRSMRRAQISVYTVI